MTDVLRLELEGTDDPILGVVRSADGSSQPFKGWLELVAAIDALRQAGSVSTPAGGPDNSAAPTAPF